MSMILLFNGSLWQEPLVPLGKARRAEEKCTLLKEVSFRPKTRTLHSRASSKHCQPASKTRQRP